MWLPLAEYSLKHKVSISTLRRKIKAADIEYRLDDGKYLILDSAEDPHRPSQTSDAASAEVSPKVQTPSAHSAQVVSSLQSMNMSQTPGQSNSQAINNGESVITAANRLLADLKKAYTQVLQDKELQIQSLKEEISDLKTLIKVLESENDRLRDNSEL